jgi:hypothetical protein
MRTKLCLLCYLLIIALSAGMNPASAQSPYPPDPPVLVPPPPGALFFPAVASQYIMVSDPNGDPLEISFFTRPVANLGPNFSIAVLPDTQNYSNRAPQIFTAQTEWIVNHQVEFNIQAVAQVGDVVTTSNASYQWQNAFNSMSLLADIPHGLAVGNHDQDPNGDPNGSTENFNSFFGIDRFASRPYYGGHYGDNNDNSYFFFSASGLDFVVIFIEYSLLSQLDVINWANNILQAFPTRFGIVVSHAIIDLNAAWSLQGLMVYEGLKNNPNLVLMLCGHYHGESYRSDIYNDHTVHTLLANYQTIPDAQSGYLRLLEFQPSSGVLQVKTYSPYIDQYLTGDSSEFSLPIDLRPAFTRQATLRDVPSGAMLRMDFTGLDLRQGYEWYVTVSDGQDVITSPTWLFSKDLTYQLVMPFILHGARFNVYKYFRMPEGRFRNFIPQ